jgi:hypothetical protein
MSERDEAIAAIRRAFAGNEYPGDGFLQGSFEGEEPFEVARAFQGKDDWQALDAAFLDADPAALSFFSEAALRFYLPAYLIADLREELVHIDVLFHLTQGFRESSVDIEVNQEKFTRQFGRSALVNPIRYGAMTWHDHARHRLSIFTRDEAQAIVAYLEYKQLADETGLEQSSINAALSGFWQERAAEAPTAAELLAHQENEARFMEALAGDDGVDL